MRVTHVITRLIVGGAQENTISSVLGLADKPNLQVDLISGHSWGPEGSLEWMFKPQPHLLRVLPDLVRPVRPWIDLRATRSLAGIFRREKPVIVHTHSGKAGIVGRLAARLARVPIIIHTIHGPSFGPFQGTIANTVFRTAEKFAARWTTHFVTVAQAMTDQYLAAGIGNADQFTRIFSGFDLGPFLAAENDAELRERLGIRPGDIVVGKIARLFKLKGHDDVLAAAGRLIKAIPNIKFLWVGDGEWRSRFEGMIAERGWQSYFVMTGLVPPSEVPRFLGIMDIVIHLSLREGLARVLPQALAAQKPIVAYDCDGAREVCLMGQTGYLVAPGDIGVLTEKIQLLAQNEALRSQLGSQGREMVKQLFPVQKMVDELHALYLRLAAA